MSEVKRKIVRMNVLDEEDLMDFEEDYDYEVNPLEDEEQKYFYSDEEDIDEVGVMDGDIIQEDDLSEENSKDFIKQVLTFLSSKGFKKGYTKYAEIHNQRKEVIKDNLSKKILRKIGEVFDISICVTYDFCGFLIKLLTKLLNQAVDIVYKAACSIIGFFTKKAIL